MPVTFLPKVERIRLQQLCKKFYNKISIYTVSKVKIVRHRKTLHFTHPDIEDYGFSIDLPNRQAFENLVQELALNKGVPPKMSTEHIKG